MPEFLVTPDKTVDIDGKSYTLSGSLKALKAIQHLVQEDIFQFLPRLRILRFEQLAEIIKIGIESGGAVPPLLCAIEQAIIDDIGLIETRELILVWLTVAITPKRDREKKARDLANILNPSPSPGMNTSESPPAS